MGQTNFGPPNYTPDTPLQQNATFRLDQVDRAYIDGQILALQKAVQPLSLGGGGGGGTTVHAGINNTNYTVAETAGTIYVGFKSLAGAVLLNIPGSPASGMRIIARSEDNTLTDANTITWTPSSGNIERANVSATTFVMTKTIAGVNGSLEFIYDGTLWRALA